MRDVILVTHRYAETGCPAGLYAGATARALTGMGHRVDVVTGLTPAARPRHETAGRLTVHRLEARDRSDEAGFAIAAARRVHELAGTRREAVVECIDAPSCLAALAGLRVLAASALGLVSINLDPRAAFLVEGCAGVRVSAEQLPCPLVEGVWSAPKATGPTVVACGSGGEADIAEASGLFEASCASAEGWSLVAMGRDGRWETIKQGRRDAADRRTLALRMGDEAGVAGLFALRDGAVSVAGDGRSAAIAIDRLVAMDHVSLSELATRELAKLRAAHEPDFVVTAHRRLWDAALAKTENGSTRKAWVGLERQLAGGQAGGPA